MSEPEIDVLCVGNAIVDVLAYADDGFLEAHQLPKGTMRLVDGAEAAALYKDLPPGIEASGGSAANTAVGVAGLGGRAAFIGRVGDDQLGAVFTHDIRNAGVHFDTPPAKDGPPTAQCLVVVTPDAQRTMSTYLGASQLLAPADIDVALVDRAAVTYLEGYLWDPPEAKDAFRAAMDTARAARRRVAFSLSDAFCVDRFRDEFLDLLAGPVDVMFANEAEACSLFQVDSLGPALRQLQGMCEIVVVTRGAAGSTVLANGEQIDVPAAPVDHVVDTTGAGDLYAAGFLYGLTHGMDLRACADLAGRCAAAVLSHLGPRPQTSLADLL